MSAGGPLPGFRDFYPPEFAERAWLFGVWRSVAGRFGFVEYDGPPLEPLELYTKKSGEEIVGQLYNFEDKGGRAVSLRPEMTPTVARMVAARANALRKPVRWFSVPQLFRYERQQKGRLREHFQLNVDIFGEADVAADAELLAVACEIMVACGLGPEEVHARVSDRRLLSALLTAAGVHADALGAAFGAIDKIEREDAAAFSRRLAAAGVEEDVAQRVRTFVRGARRPILQTAQLLDEAEALFGAHADVREARNRFTAYVELLEAHGVADYAVIDLSIVRGLAYYTGIVFELFDTRGEFRAVCGGGRYDNLLAGLGGVDMPALGFGMGDVVLAELLRARGRMPRVAPRLDYWVANADGGSRRDTVAVAAALRREGATVEYALRDQALARQLKTATTAGAAAVVLVGAAYAAARHVEVKSLQDGSQVSISLDSLLEQVRARSRGATDRP